MCGYTQFIPQWGWNSRLHAGRASSLPTQEAFLVNPTFSRPTPRLSSVHTLSTVHRTSVCICILYTHILHIPMFLLVASNFRV